MRDVIRMRDVSRNRGETVSRKKAEDLLRFAQEVGTVRAFGTVTSSKGKQMWRIEPAHGGTVDLDRRLMFAA